MNRASKELVQALAAKLSAAFETRKRDNGDEFKCLRDGSPDWMTSVVQDAHGNMMPNDERYRLIEETLDAIVNADDVDDITVESDIYNADLTAWLASHNVRQAYCQDAVDEMDIDPDTDIMGRIGWGQYMERTEILGMLLDALATVDAEEANP